MVIRLMSGGDHQWKGLNVVMFIDGCKGLAQLGKGVREKSDDEQVVGFFSLYVVGSGIG